MNKLILLCVSIVACGLIACLEEVEDQGPMVQYTFQVQDDSTLALLQDVSVQIQTTHRQVLKNSTDKNGRAQTQEFEASDFQLSLTKSNYYPLDTLIQAPTDSIEEGSIHLEILKLKLQVINP